MLCGLLVALTIRQLPGTAGHSPALGFTTGSGPATGRDLPGIVLAALATLGLGAVLGPEAPLIAVGGGLAALTVRLVKRDAPPMAVTIMASAGSFAAVSTLLGSPLLGAFLIMEAAGIAGATLSLVALPGLMASGIGALVFVGMDAWTGLGTFSLALTTVPPAVSPRSRRCCGRCRSASSVRCSAGRSDGSALSVRPLVHRNRVPVTVGLGLLSACAPPPTSSSPDAGSARCCSPGRARCPASWRNARPTRSACSCCWRCSRASPTVCRSAPSAVVRCSRRCSSGRVLGVALSGLPGMELAAAIGMGIGAMCCAMLRLPLTSVLLATLIMGADGLTITPQVVVAVVVSFVVTLVLPAAGPPQPVDPAPPGVPAGGAAPTAGAAAGAE